MEFENKGKLKVYGNQVGFYCPGCKGYHTISIGGDSTKHPVWKFNGNYENPTLTPSVLVTSGHYTPSHKPGDRCWCDYNKEHPDHQVINGCSRCHSFITDGKIQYLSDCTHEFAGQTIDMIDPDNV